MIIMRQVVVSCRIEFYYDRLGDGLYQSSKFRRIVCLEVCLVVVLNFKLEILVVNFVGLRLGCICSFYSVSVGGSGDRGKEVELRERFEE